MDMSDSRVIRAPRDRVWVALNDPAVLKQCVFGCESLDRQDDGSLVAAMAVRVGPVAAKFKGKLHMENVAAPEHYTLVFEGNGGAAGFAKGSAEVTLTDAEGGGTLLQYKASSQVGGKLAQVGSRLVDAAARKIADDFFTKFGELVAPAAAAPAGDETATAASTGAAGATTKSGGLPVVWIVAGAITLAIIGWWLTR